LGTLQPPDRRLILSVHVRGDSVAKIARQLGQNVRRLYSKVNVLRDLLGDCVRNKLADRGVT
jgi:RNA polymerase sigma-70 factor (ECF subfamily)